MLPYFTGSELLAIDGAIETIRTVDVLVTEVPVMNYNQGAPSFLQVFNALDDLGFAFYDIVDTIRSANDNILLQFDVMWVKKNSTLWAKECTSFPVPAYFSEFHPRHELRNKRRRISHQAST